jgi:hypothetical protein
LSKHQLGLRIDRILYKQFQQVLTQEKLRPSEAIEALVKLAVQAGGVSSLIVDQTKRESSGSMIDDALFRSRLARLKTSLELEERYWKETGDEVEQKESEFFVQELTQIGRRSVSQELVKEFEACLAVADKQYEEMEKSYFENEINDHKT